MLTMNRITMALGLAVAVAGCGGDASMADDQAAEDAADRALDGDAVVVTIGLQHTIDLDRNLAKSMTRVLKLARGVDAPGVSVKDIHARATESLTSIVAQAEGPIAQAFAKGQLKTGNKALDALLKQHKATSVSVEFEDFFQILFAKPIKTSLMAESLRTIPGIKSADPDELFGDGDDITVTRNDASKGFEVNFIHGFGDCPAGCISHTSTRVFVGDDSKVALLSIGH